MIIRNKLSEEEFLNKEKIKRNEFLELSLKNSTIKNAKQYFISYHDCQLAIPYLLGINYSTSTNKWIEYTNKINRDTCLMNESVLMNLLKENGLEEFDSQLNCINSLKLNKNSGFSYEK